MNDEMKQFFTREVAQEGKRIPLSRPDGTETEHWLTLQGIDSDSFRDAFADERKVLLEKGADGEVGERDMTESRNRMLSKLVPSWSFDLPCTPENVKAFLTESPQIAEKLNALAADRRYFFGSKGKSSAS